MHHPIGLQPEGNLLFATTSDGNCRDAGLGRLYVLTDALMLEVLSFLEAADLAKLSCASQAFYAFCDHEDLWKACVIETFAGSFAWCGGTWRRSYVASRLGNAPPPQLAVDAQPDQPAEQPCKRRRQAGGRSHATKPPAGPQRVQLRNFYSDLLYQPYHCASVELPEEWLAVDNVDRRKGLSPQEFREQYELPNQPVVLMDGAADWPALNKWTPAYLRKAYGDHPVIAGNFEIPFSTYMSYADSTRDEMPLYLFDKAFGSAASQLSSDFSVPSVFQEDLFSVLGATRPDYRWLIAGPARSGSTFHIDPNSTSAWNGVVTGAKKWLLYPPGVVPPGVFPSVDGADVATSVSLVEWFLNFYSEAAQSKVRPLECVVRPGEVMFVPRGWWHACINLSWTVAVTQNFVSSVNLKHVISFLRSGREDLVSGCAHGDRSSLHDKFVAALQRDQPHLLEGVEAERRAARQKTEQARKLTSLFASKSDATPAEPPAGPSSSHVAVSQPGSFSFSFSL